MHEARKSGRPRVANEKKQIIVQMLDSGMLGGGSVGGDGAIDAAVPGWTDRLGVGVHALDAARGSPIARGVPERIQKHSSVKPL